MADKEEKKSEKVAPKVVYSVKMVLGETYKHRYRVQCEVVGCNADAARVLPIHATVQGGPGKTSSVRRKVCELHAVFHRELTADEVKLYLADE